MQRQIDLKKLNQSFKCKKIRSDVQDENNQIPTFLNKSIDSAKDNLNKEAMKIIVK